MEIAITHRGSTTHLASPTGKQGTDQAVAQTLRAAGTSRALVGVATLLIAMLAFPAQVLAFDNYKVFKRDAWDFETSSQFYRTESNYGSNGKSEKLGSGKYLQLIDLNLGTRYFYGKNSSLYFSGIIGASESKDGIATRSNSSFNQVILGADYLAYAETFDIVPEISLVVPTDKIAQTTGDTVLNSEGVFELRPRMTLQKDFGSLGAYVYGGFTYRDEGRSFLLPWGVGSFLNFSNSRLGAELFGYQSVADDKDTNSKSVRLAYLSRADAGSYRFGAFNPSLVDTNFFYHVGLRGPWSFEVDGGLSLAGTNTADGLHVGALIRYTFDMTAGYSEKPRYQAPTSVPHGRSGMHDNDPALSTERPNQFREDTNDGVDQRIFRPKPTRRIRADQDPKLQKQLDDTEMQIELKSNKSRKKKKRRH